MEKLWQDIQLIYENSFKNEFKYIGDLIIVSHDNYYHLNYKDSVNIKIEKDYNLVRIWGGDVTYDLTNYKLHVELNNKVELDENKKIELVYKIITPHLREVKLSQLKIND